jgi:hypothetical protein
MLINRRGLIYIFLSFFCILLSACTVFTTTQPIHPTTQNDIQNTADINSITKASETRIPSPTYIIVAVQTNTPYITPSPSNTSTKTVAATSTTSPKHALKETQVASFSASCDDNYRNIYSSLLSPKGNWLALPCGDKYDQNLRIYNHTGKKWELQYKDFADEQNIQYGGQLYPVHWANDEKYLYFRSSVTMSAGGTCFYGGLGQGLYRLDINNGTVDATLPPLKNMGLYLFSFSPSGRWLAVDSYILDLQTGEKIFLEGREYTFGDFTWSPDSSKLAYSSCLSSSQQFVVYQSAIRIFSLETRTSKTILHSETPNVFLRIDPMDDNRLKIYDDYWNKSSYSFYDWSTGQLTTPSLTPTP